MMQLQLLNAPERARVPMGSALVHQLAERAEELTGLGAGVLYRQGRSRDVAWVRFAVMKAAHERGRSLSTIARAMGGLNHTSVLYGVRRAGELEQDVPEFGELLKLLRRELRG